MALRSLQRITYLKFQISLNLPVLLPAACLKEGRCLILREIPGLTVKCEVEPWIKSTRIPLLGSWELMSGDWLRVLA